MRRQPVFFCPLYGGKITQYDCDEIMVCVKTGQMINDGLPPLLDAKTLLTRKNNCLKCKHFENANNRVISTAPKSRVALVIEKEKGGMRPLEIESEEKQRLTIDEKGMVWFTVYGVSIEKEWEYKALRKIRCRIDAKKAVAILKLAEQLLDEVHGVFEPRVCDGEMDVLSFTRENGVKQKQVIIEENHPLMTKLYEEIRKVVPIDNLLLFNYDFYTE